MRAWLKMAGASTTSLTSLEGKTRYFHLSESKIRQEQAVILKVLLPPNIIDKLKVCTSMIVLARVTMSFLSSPEHCIDLLVLKIWELLLCLLWWFLSKLKFLLPSTENPLVCGRPSPCHSGQCEYNQTINRHICRCPAGILGDKCQIGEPCYSLRNRKHF